MPKDLKLPEFKDLYPAYAPVDYYPVTNEEPELLRKMINGLRFKKAACIASGGEVLLTVVLPNTDQVIAVDHSYRSLMVSYLKMLLLQKIGIKKFLTLMEGGNKEHQEFVALLEGLHKHLPKSEATQRYKSTELLGNTYNTHALRREWYYANKTGVTKAVSSPEKVTFVHGDITDLPAVYGQFDLVYASNAMEHKGRNGKSLRKEDLHKLLVPGGTLLYTSANLGVVEENNLFKPVQQVKGYRTTWIHIALVAKEQVQQAAQVAV